MRDIFFYIRGYISSWLYKLYEREMSDNQDAVNVTQSAVNEGVIQENPVSQPVAAAEKKP